MLRTVPLDRFMNLALFFNLSLSRVRLHLPPIEKKRVEN